MKSRRSLLVLAFALMATLLPASAFAVVTVYFSPGQVATPVSVGETSDEISCEGYLFTYTRDKLFTGGGPEPIGRGVRVPWPTGIEAQYVTTGPTARKAQIQIRRLDGGVFDFTSFTARLLANAGAGRAIEIVPMLNGEEPLPDPLFFDVSGNYWNTFSYDTSPNPWGSTAPLVGYDEYRVNLTLDYALIALTLTDDSPPVSVEPGPGTRGGNDLWAAPNPARGSTRIRLASGRQAPGGRVEVYSLRGERVRSLALAAGVSATWDLRDDGGRPVAAGLYFAKLAAPGAAALRVVVTR